MICFLSSPCFQFLTVVIKVLCILVYKSFNICFYFSWVNPRKEIWGHRYIFNVVRNCQALFQSACITLHCRQLRAVSVLCIVTDIWCFHFWSVVVDVVSMVVFSQSNNFLNVVKYTFSYRMIKCIILTVFKGTVQWHWVHSHCLATITIMNFFIISNWNFVPVK